MIAALAEAALRSFALGGVVWIGLILFRVRNPHVHMTAWVVVLLEIGSALLLAAVAVRELRRASSAAPRAAVVAGGGRTIW